MGEDDAHLQIRRRTQNKKIISGKSNGKPEKTTKKQKYMWFFLLPYAILEKSKLKRIVCGG
jgi:hypothetical protein